MEFDGGKKKKKNQEMRWQCESNVCAHLHTDAIKANTLVSPQLYLFSQILM